MLRLLVFVLVAVAAAVFGVAVSRREDPPPTRSPWSPELLRLIDATRPGAPGRKVVDGLPVMHYSPV